MEKTLLPPSLIQLIFDLGSKVNHDLMGFMHVIDFCTEELAGTRDLSSSNRTQDYLLKLRSSTSSATELVRHHRVAARALKEAKENFSLADGVQLAFSLSCLIGRTLSHCKCQIVPSREMRSTFIELDEVILLSFLFDQLVRFSQGNSLIEFEKKDNSVPLSFTLSGFHLSSDWMDQKIIPTEHLLLSNYNLKNKQNFKVKIQYCRDMIDTLRSNEGKAQFYFRTDFLSIKS